MSKFVEFPELLKNNIDDIYVLDDESGTSLIIEFEHEGKLAALSFDLKIPDTITLEDYFEDFPIYTEGEGGE